jgi:6-phosphogluconolactonase
MIRQAEKLTQKLLIAIQEKEGGGNFSVALSGGSSPVTLFRLWREKYLNDIPWKKIDFYWVDERCVHPEHPLSNFGMARRELFSYLPEGSFNIFRIKGECEPEDEARNYSRLVLSRLPVKIVNAPVFANDLFEHQSIDIPVFDCVLLGIGDDGHTSSIFPGDTELLYYARPFGVAVNPYTGQKRVAMTGYPLQYAAFTAFWAEGESKSEILDRVVYASGDLLLPETDPKITALPAANILRRSINSQIFYGV